MKKSHIHDRINKHQDAFFAPLHNLPGQWGAKNDHKFIDNGGDVLVVAHTDSVVNMKWLHADNNIIRCPMLDDRIGVWIALYELPRMGIKVDVLLTKDEEFGASTASHFVPTKSYNWIAEFDRGGDDVALYQYKDAYTDKLVSAAGYKPSYGIYTDISDMEFMGIKAFNFGVGYRDYHSANAHIYTHDLSVLMGRFAKFWNANAGISMPHTIKPQIDYRWSSPMWADYQKPLKSYKPSNPTVVTSDWCNLVQCDCCGALTGPLHLRYDPKMGDWMCDDCVYWMDKSQTRVVPTPVRTTPARITSMNTFTCEACGLEFAAHQCHMSKRFKCILCNGCSDDFGGDLPIDADGQVAVTCDDCGSPTTDSTIIDYGNETLILCQPCAHHYADRYNIVTSSVH